MLRCIGFSSRLSTLFRRKQPLTGCPKNRSSQNLGNICQIFVKDELIILVNLSYSCPNPVCIYLFKVNNRSTRTRYEICSKLTIKTPERRQWRRSGVFVNIEHISYLVLVLLLLTLNR